MNEITDQELNELEQLIDGLRRGQMTRAEFRSRSVHHGVYTERQPGRFFVRIRVPMGILSLGQMTRLADALETHGQGECHLTTRQGVEVHALLLDQISPLLRTLAAVDLLSHETGGNSIRSIMLCPHAGVGADEPFDVTPYAELVTRHFVRHPDFQALPRKMKIAFSCCAQDCVRSFAQDLGLQARKNARGDCGFRVLVGGGTGALPRLGQPVLEFLPAEQVCRFTEAFLRVFNRLGNRQNRRRARVKFLVESLGLETLRKAIIDEWTAVQREPTSYPALRPTCEFAAQPAPDVAAAASPRQTRQRRPRNQAFTTWASAQTRPQRQQGFDTIRVSPPGGVVTAGQLRHLAGLTERFGLTVRTTPEQSFLLCWACENQLPQIHEALDHARLLNRLAVSRLVACPGSNACSNAFTNTPALAQAITARLASLPGPTSALAQLRIRLCGCPNGCTLHAIADIGLEGIARRAQNQWLPAYRIWLGGRECQQHPRFGQDLGLLPASQVPECVAAVAGYYLQFKQQDESLADVMDRVGIAPFAALVQRHQPGPAHDRRRLTIDWGETEPYRPRDVNAPGVC